MTPPPKTEALKPTAPLFTEPILTSRLFDQVAWLNEAPAGRRDWPIDFLGSAWGPPLAMKAGA